MRLPYGQYLIVAEIPDAAGNVHHSNLTVNVNANTMTADIVISDLVVAAAGKPDQSATAPSPANTSLCGAGLLVPVLGICVFMIGKRRSNEGPGPEFRAHLPGKATCSAHSQA